MLPVVEIATGRWIYLRHCTCVTGHTHNIHSTAHATMKWYNKQVQVRNAQLTDSAVQFGCQGPQSSGRRWTPATGTSALCTPPGSLSVRTLGLRTGLVGGVRVFFGV